MRYRLIKPLWGQRVLPNGKPNPKYVRDIPGPNTYEGEDYSAAFLKEQNDLGFNIYYFPNTHSKKIDSNWMNGTHVDIFNWAFVDMDLKDQKYSSKEAFLERLKEFPLKPTHVVDSGNGIHAYWRVLDVDGDAIAFMSIQKALILEFNTDISVWTPLQLMRREGFKNTKDPTNFKEAVRLPAWDSQQEYTVEQLAEHLPEIDKKAESDIKLHWDKLNGVVSVEIKETLKDGLPKKFLQLLEREPYIAGLFNDPQGSKGDRSAADLALANFLIAKADFDRAEALQVLMNTQKAQSRQGRSRYDYALNTLEKACRDCTPMAVQSAEEFLANPTDDEDLGEAVRGPYFLDALYKPWRKKQLLGLIAGSGVGKTALSLKIFEQFIKNNDTNDDIFFFFSLEMTVGEVLGRWKALVGDNPEYVKRLFVVGQNQFQNAEGHTGANLQGIYRIVRDTCIQTGKKVGVVCIDHLDAMEGDVDLGIRPNFNAETSKYLERRVGARTVILSKDGLCQKLKALAQMLDTFVIIQSQTTKGKDDGGDQPIGKNAAFGTSKFEWFCDYVVGVWRPLARAMDKCREHNLFVTAYQYAKIREQKPDKDNIQLLDRKLIKFLPTTEDFIGLTDEDKVKFDEILDTAIKLRELDDKKKMKKYSKAPVEKLRLILNNAAKPKES